MFTFSEETGQQALEYVQQAIDGLITKDEMANMIEALFPETPFVTSD
jgi:hypothetical protein